MADQRALWRRAYDAVERNISPSAESLVRGEDFAAAVSRVKRTQGAVRRAVDSQTRAAWHLLNLPTRSDVRALQRQLGELDRELRLLRTEAERERRARKETDGGDTRN